MTTHATGTIVTTSWDEQPYSKIEGGGKLTHTHMTDTLQGDIEGEGVVEYLMTYRHDGAGSFVGFERVIGHIGERSGSFVLQHSGVFEQGQVKGTWSVVPGSGTGDLRGLRGAGGYLWAGEGSQSTPFTLDYDFE